MGQESLVELELNSMNEDLLMERMAGELPEIRESLKLSVEQIADKVGIDRNRLLAVEAGNKDLKWSEYLSILFLFWRDDIGRTVIESKGLFPEKLKRVMSVNRNVHAPDIGNF